MTISHHIYLWPSIHFLLFLPYRSSQRSPERERGGHPCPSADPAVGDLRIRRDTLPQLQPDRTVPVCVQPAGVCCWGADIDLLSLHSEGTQAFRDGQTTAGAGQPRGQQGERGDRQTDGGRRWVGLRWWNGIDVVSVWNLSFLLLWFFTVQHLVLVSVWHDNFFVVVQII